MTRTGRITRDAFIRNTTDALRDAALQRALKNVGSGFIQRRRDAIEGLAEFDQLRARARAIKEHALAHLDLYLETFEANVRAAGGQVHWAADGQSACRIVEAICADLKVQRITKGKSMISEEMGINGHLEARGYEVTETDLGEYIIQLRGETPSHIIAPAIHLNRDQVEAEFRRTHTHLDAARDLEAPEDLLREARAVLRERFLAADAGITGANFLIAETGSSVIVTNEGNGDLTQTLPKVHIVLASIEKIVPTLNDCAQILRLLARSATGQAMTVYTTFSTGPRRAADPDGPEHYHVVLLDNGRSAILGTPGADVLRCIRCGACINHCPVYKAIGGHAYGSTYSGPIGAALSPVLEGIETTGHLSGASTFCGRCEEVCPMGIPLPRLMRHWREHEFSRHHTPATQRWGLRLWAHLARRPRLYRWTSRLAIGFLARLGRRRGAFGALPLAGGWTVHRDLPAPQGDTFMAQWKKKTSQRAANGRSAP